MGRLTWFVAGAGVGIAAATRGRKALQPISGDELRDRVHAASIGLKQARQAAAQARVDREVELRERLAAGPTTASAPDEVSPEPPIQEGRH
ncbi:MAG: DUF6167 family protein [Nocardioides sp.]